MQLQTARSIEVVLQGLGTRNFISSSSFARTFLLSWVGHVAPPKDSERSWVSRLILHGIRGASRQSPATYTQPTQPWKRPNFGC